MALKINSIRPYVSVSYTHFKALNAYISPYNSPEMTSLSFFFLLYLEFLKTDKALDT